MDSDFRELEAAARELRKEWDSPSLWPRIEASIQAGKRPRRSWWVWPAAAALAASLALALALPFVRSRRPAPAAGQPLLTQQALAELEKTEAAYMQSIDRLAKLVEPELAKTKSPLMAAYREKLTLLDAALAELRIEAAANPHYAGLHVQLASLYRDKQSTLQEVLSHAGNAR